MKKVDGSEKRIRTEVFELENPVQANATGVPQIFDKWSRVELNGDLLKWIPHNEFGEVQNPTVSTKVEEKLEERYKNLN